MTRVRRPSSLRVRIALLAVGAAVLTALTGGGVAIGLISHAEGSSARAALARLADATAAAADSGAVQTGALRTRRTLQALRVQYATVGAAGAVSASSTLSRDAVQPSDVKAVLAGRSVSATRRIDGSTVLVEARPVRSGGIVVVQRRSDALATVGRVVRRLLLALVFAVVLAAVAGLVVAGRLAGPLRRVAAAAHALAGGRRDVTVRPEGPAEVAEVAEAVNTLAGNLASSEGRQRQFLMSVSHELRTPLTAITGYAESLAEGVVPPGDVPRVGAVMGNEARRLDRLVADLLDLARLDAADFRIDLVPVNITELVLEAAQVWASRCAAESVVFRLEAPTGVLPARTDPVRLRQAVDGLLENALRVTAAGAPIVLAARAEPGPRPVVVEVRDGGPGLTPDDVAVAFERGVLYERYRGVRRVGTGLGLAFVHGLVSRLGGTIEAGSAPEGGARFTIRIPG